MYTYLKNAAISSKSIKGFKGAKKNILIEDERILEVCNEDISLPEDCKVVDCEDLLVLPGVIDPHVHFRQPGAEYKADMNTESLAALAGGVTSVFDMPNNSPAIVTEELLQEKYSLCQENMHCNYSLYFGLTNNNIEQAINLEQGSVAGLKLFLGSSTGNMLVDKKESIEYLFRKSPFVITAHCEDEQIIRENTQKYETLSSLPYNIHSLIRTEEACYLSSRFAVDLAKRYNTQFHLAHLTTKKELSLLTNDKLEDKHITSEVSPNHLFFSEEDYKTLGNLIKCNPAIKTSEDRKALRQALKEGFIDMVATDHAPHLLSEKQKDYFSAPSGIPSIQFSLLMMLEIAQEEQWDLSLIVEKMMENPALRFNIKKRGFIKPRYFADLVFVKLGEKQTVRKENILSKCAFSPLENHCFNNSVYMTMLSGKIVYKDGRVEEKTKANKLEL